MRTTIELDDDTAAVIERVRRERGIGVSEAVNALIRQGVLPRPEPPRFSQRTHHLGIKIDVSNIAEALDVLEGPDAR